jgi:Holliday junction resolvase RusA-like endonuclease
VRRARGHVRRGRGEERMIAFRVYGIPKPGGSKKGFVVKNKYTGKPRAVIVDDCKKNKEWRESVMEAARTVKPPMPLFGPLMVVCVFYLPRIKAHYRTGKQAQFLKSDAPLFHTTKPDATKLWRSTEDALTGIIWRDDAQIAHQVIVKRYTSDNPGAEIKILEATEALAEAAGDKDRYQDIFERVGVKL